MTGKPLRWRRPLAFGLAAAVFLAGGALAQDMSLAERIQLCGACHGEDGNSKIEDIPSLAGQPAFFILNQLFLMREGVRKIEAMAPIVKDLKDEDLDALSKHYAALPPKPSGRALNERRSVSGTDPVTSLKFSTSRSRRPDEAGRPEVLLG